ncbi:type I-E CRISPR-associated protein Cas5/CasD [Streptomyces sparsogenes]|uniref:type I-E CRISPR-associated protein Cas5/CasD n=1 Tax=Streptomyces sparsogenes TaxID=67365 RepID=UPI00332F2734
MRSGLLLRLAGPLQSWGERSAFNVRDSAAFPTRSALCGMFAAAQGHDRMADPRRYADLEFTVRVDRPGRRLVDYHTVGGGLSHERTVATSGGKHKGAAVVSRRHYLADAVFVVAVTGPDSDITPIADALEHPHWAPYLGRRSCVPDEPLLLRPHVCDPVTELLTKVPLTPPEETPGANRAGRAPSGTLLVDFLHEHPWDTMQQDTNVLDGTTAIEVADVPESFAPHARRYGTRRLYKTAVPVPTALMVSRDENLSDRLISYALGAAA